MMDEELLFDRRLVRRWIDKGLLTESDLESHLAGLPDSAQNADNIDLSTRDHATGDKD